MDAFRDLRGREPDIAPLLRRRGLDAAERRPTRPRRSATRDGGVGARRLPAPGVRQGPGHLRGGRRAAAVRGQRPDQRLRPRAAHPDPGQGPGAHRDERVLVRAAGRRGRQPSGVRGRPTDPGTVLGRAMLVRRLEMLPVECVARGYLTGSGSARLPGHRRGLRHRAAARAGRVVAAARADLHPGAPRPSSVRTTRTSAIDAVAADGRRRAAPPSCGTHPGAVSPGRRARRDPRA